jgi:hypothetical protein
LIAGRQQAFRFVESPIADFSVSKVDLTAAAAAPQLARSGMTVSPNTKDNRSTKQWPTPAFYLGVPKYWSDEQDEHLGPLHVAIDPINPPTYEPQAMYLERLALLASGELRKLKRSDFVPESVLDILASATNPLGSDSSWVAHRPDGSE